MVFDSPSLIYLSHMYVGRACVPGFGPQLIPGEIASSSRKKKKKFLNPDPLSLCVECVRNTSMSTDNWPPVHDFILFKE